MSLVIDSSMALAWYFQNERTSKRMAVLSRVTERGAIAPGIWPLEIANSLRTAMRRKRITTDFRNEALEAIRMLPVQLDDETNEQMWSITVGISDRLGLTVYDATYVELVLRLRLPLATLDQEIIVAARRESIELIGLED